MSALPGGADLVWLCLAAVLAGLVRGFSGFGTALVFLPVAGQVMPPFAAITTLIVMDLVGPLPNVPRALRDGAPGDIGRLLAGMVATLPLGIAILAHVPAEVFRYAVSGLSLGMVGLLALGLRYRGRVTPPLVYATGAVAGLSGGVAGVPGPPVILFYMASPLPASAVRANVLLFLLATDVALLAGYAAAGRLVPAALWTGLLLIPPYVLANMAGAATFRPERERLYRVVAYLVVAGAALLGLPLWD